MSLHAAGLGLGNRNLTFFSSTNYCNPEHILLLFFHQDDKGFQYLYITFFYKNYTNKQYNNLRNDGNLIQTEHKTIYSGRTITVVGQKEESAAKLCSYYNQTASSDRHTMYMLFE